MLVEGSGARVIPAPGRYMSISQTSIDALLAEAADLGAASEGGSSPAEAPSAPAGPPPLSGLPLPRTTPQEPDIRRILSLTVPVSVTLAERDLDVEAILGIKVGMIIEFEVRFDADLTLNVADHPIGAGQAVKIGENFGLRITQITGVKGRIEAMAKGKGSS